jgi:hypothetical protein
MRHSGSGGENIRRQEARQKMRKGKKRNRGRASRAFAGAQPETLLASLTKEVQKDNILALLVGAI